MNITRLYHSNEAKGCLPGYWERTGEGGGGGGVSFCPCLGNLTIDYKHHFRDGPPFLLLLERPPTVRRSFRCLRIQLTKKFLLILSPSYFAACGHHLSPRVAVVLSLLSSVPNFSMSHYSIFLILSSNTSRFPFYIRHSATDCVAFPLY